MRSESAHRMLRWAYLPECEAPPRGWRVAPFPTLADVIAGQSPPSETYNDKGQGLPFLQGNGDFSSVSPVPRLWCTASAKRAAKGDSLISVRAPVGEMNRADQDYAIGRGLAAIRARERCDPSFLEHALQRWRWSLQRVAQGTTFDAVTARHFAQLSVCVPEDRDEQAAIARILDAVGTALERTRAAVERARELRGSLLFELLSRGIGSDGTIRRMDANPDDFVATKLGRLPTAWRLSTVDAEFDLQNGFTLNATRRARFKRRRYLRVANVRRDALDLSDVQELEAGDSELAPRVLEEDDLLVIEGHADRMQIGRCARVTPEAVGMTFQNHLFRLRTRGEVHAAFACLWLNSYYAQRFWNARCATSSGLNTINQRTLKKLVIPSPSADEQNWIAEVARRQRQHLEALMVKQVRLLELKQALMHDLLTGRVRVPGAIKENAQ